jgi:hypothetical protein
MTPERRKCAIREAPQRRPLLDNGSLGSSASTDGHENNRTVGDGDLYSVRPEVIKGQVIDCVEAGSSTSTVTLRVVQGDGKGSLNSETVKYDHESHGLVVDKVELRQVFSEYFGFPCQSSFHQFLHHHNHPGLAQ